MFRCSVPVSSIAVSSVSGSFSWYPVVEKYGYYIVDKNSWWELLGALFYSKVISWSLIVLSCNICELLTHSSSLQTVCCLGLPLLCGLRCVYSNTSILCGHIRVHLLISNSCSLSIELLICKSVLPSGPIWVLLPRHTWISLMSCIYSS